MTMPLAEKMRPKELGEVIGQGELIGKGKILSEIVKNKQPVNLIFWGPPGSGKTTLARIMAKELEADFVELSAVTSGKKDIERVIELAKVNRNLQITTLLFVDEIHRFNKAQQDAFLPHVENGLITLIGATTENPSFEVIKPLLSRSRVVVLKPHDKTDIVEILKNAVTELGAVSRIDPEALNLIAELSGGDARAALGTLELSFSLVAGKQKVSQKVVSMAAQKRLPGYDKNGEMHYDVISAYIKSMRGSDPTAACYYLARMLSAGEDPKFIARRMVVFASEDIGLKGNGALSLANAVFESVEKVGMPECRYALFHGTVALARSEKSREIVDVMNSSDSLAERFMDAPIPLVLRNAPTELMKDLGYGKGYSKKKQEGFLPEEVAKFLNKERGD